MHVVKKWAPTAIFMVAIVSLFALVFVKTVQARPPVCPKIYAPVTCDNGKTYVNQCVADRHHATGCVPTGL